ncbi:MAG: hypothetical protein KGJ62_09790 [Armatimonadetes bacterium]|nr:hypothetical protein [Armatimonadota bacterium]MDE2205762.1 hypothetical protein [Armatimonadota bacterium]
MPPTPSRPDPARRLVHTQGSACHYAGGYVSNRAMLTAELDLRTELRRRRPTQSTRGIPEAPDGLVTMCKTLWWVLALVALSMAPIVASATGEVAATPAIVAPNQLVTLHWYFTGSRVTVRGGRFGVGKVVTGLTSVTDHPRVTTTYTFDAWYRAPATVAGAGSRATVPVHVQYSVTVPVVKLATYHDSHGWSISYVGGWRHDNQYVAGEGSDGLVYFQQAMDSVERLTVAVIPETRSSCADVVQQIQQDIPNHYTAIKLAAVVPTTFHAMPAIWSGFTGGDESHPGVRTRSLILTLMHGGKAYVVSARTAVWNYTARLPLLKTLVESLAFDAVRTQSTTPAARHSG